MTLTQKLKIVLITLIVVCFLIFAGQNWQKTTVTFINLQINIHLFTALMISFVVGLGTGFLLFKFRSRKSAN